MEGLGMKIALFGFLSLAFLGCIPVEDSSTESENKQCEYLSAENFSATYFPAESDQAEFDSLQISRDVKQYEIRLFWADAIDPDVIRNLSWKGDYISGTDEGRLYSFKFRISSDCAATIKFKDMATNIWEYPISLRLDNTNQDASSSSLYSSEVEQQTSSSSVNQDGEPGPEAKQCELFGKQSFRVTLVSDSGGVWRSIYDSLIFSKEANSFKSELYLRGGSIPEVSQGYIWKEDTLAGRNSVLGYDHYFTFDRACIARMIYRYDYKGFWEGPYRWVITGSVSQPSSSSLDVKVSSSIHTVSSSSKILSSSVLMSSSISSLSSSKVSSSSIICKLSSKGISSSARLSSSVIPLVSSSSLINVPISSSIEMLSSSSSEEGISSSAVLLVSSSSAQGCKLLSAQDFSVTMVADSGGASMSLYDSLIIEKTGNAMSSHLYLRGGSNPETAIYSDLGAMPVIIGRNSSLGYDNRLRFDELVCVVRMDYKYDYKGYWEGLYRWILKDE